MKRILLTGLFVLLALPLSAAEVLTLEQVLAQAREHNFAVRQADQTVRAAEAERAAALIDFFPRLEASWTGAKLKYDPVMKTQGMAMPVGTRDNYHWEFTAAQPLFTGLALTSQYRLRGLGVQIEEQTRRQTLLDLDQDVKRTYYAVLLTDKVSGVTSDAVKALEGHVHDAERLYEQEAIPLNDLLRARVGLARARQQHEQALADARLTRSRLNLLMGRELETPFGLADSTEIPAVKVDRALLEQQARELRPELQTLDLAIRAKDDERRAVASVWYPGVALASKYERDGDDSCARNNDFTNEHNATVALKATWSLGDTGKAAALMRRVSHEQQALRYRQQEAEEGIRLQIEQAVLNLHVARVNITTAEDAQSQARESWRITNLQYQQQMATSTNVLDARTDLNQAETGYFQALYGYHMALADLDRAVGR